jgi:hypothetical protein
MYIRDILYMEVRNEISSAMTALKISHEHLVSKVVVVENIGSADKWLRRVSRLLNALNCRLEERWRLRHLEARLRAPLPRNSRS